MLATSSYFEDENGGIDTIDVEMAMDRNTISKKDNNVDLIGSNDSFSTLLKGDSNNSLFISRMIFTNFKSYAGEQHVGPFDKSFTVVVGPNGSGKSNIIDGLLFVFGFRSSKLRQPKAIDLIHRSEKYPSLSFCSVKIIFSSPERETEMTLERIVYRENSRSEYRLNNLAYPLSEITSVLLEKYTIDLRHHRWLILQGEVESISMLRAKGTSTHDEGLLEYLEDIIGTSLLISQIQAKEVEWNSASTTANLAHGSLSILENELQRAKPAYEEALRDLNKFNEIQLKRTIIITHELQYLKKSKFQTLSQIKQKRNEQEQLLSLKENRLSKLVDTKKKHQSLLVEFEALKKDLEELRQKSAQKHAIATKLKEKQSHALNLITVQLEQLQSMKEQKQEKEMLLLDGKDNLVKIDESVSLLKEELRKYDEKELSSSRMDEIQVILQSHHKEKLAAENQISILEQELSLAKDSLANILKKSLIDQESLQKISKTLNMLNDELANIKKTESTFLEEKEKLSTSHPHLIQHCSRLENSVLSLSAEVQDLAENVQEPESAMNSAITEMPGVIGQLRDLYSLQSEKYAIAMERACGPSLNNWVVSTAAEGQRCIDELRRRQLGRATFLVLEELSSVPIVQNLCHSNGARVPSNNLTSDAVHRLFDLVIPNEPRLAPAFYYAIRGETLVVPDLEIGTSVAFHSPLENSHSFVGYSSTRCKTNSNDKENKSEFSQQGSARTRVVTLQGDLIEPSGAMTGGGSSTHSSSKKKPFSLFSQKKRELDTEKSQLDQSRSLLNETECRIRVLETQLLPSLVKKRLDGEKKIQELEQIKSKTKLDIESMPQAEESFALKVKQIEKTLEASKSSFHSIYTCKNTLEEHGMTSQFGEMVVSQYEPEKISPKKISSKIDSKMDINFEVITRLYTLIMEAEDEKKKLNSAIITLTASIDFLDGSITEREKLLSIAKKEQEKLDSLLREAVIQASQAEEIASEASRSINDNHNRFEVRQSKEGLESQLNQDGDGNINKSRSKNKKNDKAWHELKDSSRKERTKETKLDEENSALETYPARLRSLLVVKEKLEHEIKENDGMVSYLSEQIEKLEKIELSNIIKETEKLCTLKSSLYTIQQDKPTEQVLIQDRFISTTDSTISTVEENSIPGEKAHILGERNAIIHGDSFSSEEISSNTDKMDLDDFNEPNRKENLVELARLEKMESSINQQLFLGILIKWSDLTESFNSALKHANLATEAKESSWMALENIRRIRHQQFMDGFTFISNALKSIYQTITLGGNAELELVDTMDPFSEGVLFSVMPPKKAWKNISQLSGGEKTLSSLALLFALHKFRPTPFYVMDEIDAALDFRNVSIIANYIKDRTKNAQFIVVSLRNSMFEAADTLVGVYKTFNCTRSLAIERARMIITEPGNNISASAEDSVM